MFELSFQHLIFLQMTQKDEVVTTEVILEFHMGPEETKMVILTIYIVV